MRKITSVLVMILTFVGYSFSQNVGIGTSLPSEKLHVAGNIKTDTIKPNAIKLTSNAGSGKLLTSDAIGNASWQTNNAAGVGNIGFGVWGDCATNGNITEYHPLADATSGLYDRFGYSVSISGNYAIVGAPHDTVGFNQYQGTASMYQYNGSSWVLMQKLTDPAGAANDLFGSSVSISGNYAVVGAFGDDIGANLEYGSASIYQYNGSSWIFMQKLTDATGGANDYFGASVCISGNYVIVGAYNDDVVANINQGSASIYQYNGLNWILMQKITDATGSGGDFFGYKVSISGTFAIVGAYGDDVDANLNQGSASIYQYNGSWILMQKLTGGGAANDYFGYSVSVSGNYVCVGVLFDDGENIANQGSVYIYQVNGNTWILMQIINDANGAAGDNFGCSVSISGNYIIVGADSDDVGANTNQGSASIYLRVGLGWQKLQYVTDPGGIGGVGADIFGCATAIDGNTKRFLIGAFGYLLQSGKVVFGKVN